MVNEDVAHIVIRCRQKDVPDLLDTFFLSRGYQSVTMEDDCHLLSDVNWDSPFVPPPKYRCFMSLPDHDGWATVVDELDRLDEDLVKCLSGFHVVLAIQGHYQLEEYEYRVFEAGQEAPEESCSEQVRDALDFIRSDQDHVTRFPYDIIVDRLFSRLGFERMRFLGYMLK